MSCHDCILPLSLPNCTIFFLSRVAELDTWTTRAGLGTVEQHDLKRGDLLVLWLGFRSLVAAFSPLLCLGGSSADSSRYFCGMLEFGAAVVHCVPAVADRLVCASWKSA